MSGYLYLTGASKRNGAKAIQDYFNGGIINQTEDRAVLHTGANLRRSSTNKWCNVIQKFMK
jgi:glucose-6-phosphate isomerase